MSTYSNQINLVLQERLIPKMKSLSMDIAGIEPYSYSSTELEDSKRQFDYYSIIYDFLSEYAEGSEELNNGKLINIVRLVDAPTRERRSMDYLGTKPKSFSKVKTGYKMYIDKLEVNQNTFITAGTTINITVVYTPENELIGDTSIQLTSGSINQTSDGLSITLQNKVIPFSLGGTDLVIIVQAKENNIALTPPQVYTIPINIVIDSVFYYGSGDPGWTPAQIETLTRILEPKSSKVLEFNAIDQVLYFAYPASYGDLTSAVDPNGFQILSDFVKTTQLFTISTPGYGGGTQMYNVYTFNAAVTITYYAITFNF